MNPRRRLTISLSQEHSTSLEYRETIRARKHKSEEHIQHPSDDQLMGFCLRILNSRWLDTLVDDDIIFSEMAARGSENQSKSIARIKKRKQLACSLRFTTEEQFYEQKTPTKVKEEGTYYILRLFSNNRRDVVRDGRRANP